MRSGGASFDEFGQMFRRFQGQGPSKRARLPGAPPNVTRRHSRVFRYRRMREPSSGFWLVKVGPCYRVAFTAFLSPDPVRSALTKGHSEG